uniref:Acid sensing ion channel subunit 1 n=1 Tax=Anolis carolinensis TaxID=28377 RepID=A0A803TGZ1_ANOCA
MPGTAWPEERPVWSHLSVLPQPVQQLDDVPHAVHSLRGVQSVPSLEEFARKSTLHGIKHIICPRRYTSRSFLWTVAFLGCLAILIHVYADRVAFYFQYPHDTELEEENISGTPFPAVTLCNINPLRFSQLSGHDLYWAGELLGFLDSSDRIAAPENTDPEVLEMLSQKLEKSKGERNLPFDFKELYRRAGHSMEQMLAECKFSNETCDAGDFKTVRMNSHFEGYSFKDPIP